MPTASGADERPILLMDSSSAIALVVKDHEAHRSTLAATAGRRLGLAGHAWFETYSVLTRLPGDRRRSPSDALRVLAHNFPVVAFLDASESAHLGAELVRLGIAGGSVYDGLVGAAARQHGWPLLSGDLRARSTYEALGVNLASRGP